MPNQNNTPAYPVAALLDAKTASTLSAFCREHDLTPAEFIAYAVKIQLGAVSDDSALARYTAADARQSRTGAAQPATVYAVALNPTTSAQIEVFCATHSGVTPCAVIGENIRGCMEDAQEDGDLLAAMEENAFVFMEEMGMLAVD